MLLSRLYCLLLLSQHSSVTCGLHNTNTCLLLTVLKVYNLKLKEWHSGHSKGGVLYEVSLVTLNLVKLVLFSETD
jgi:hypothetical protein